LFHVKIVERDGAKVEDLDLHAGRDKFAGGAQQSPVERVAAEASSESQHAK
jgi:hypothetical protein